MKGSQFYNMFNRVSECLFIKLFITCVAFPDPIFHGS